MMKILVPTFAAALFVLSASSGCSGSGPSANRGTGGAVDTGGAPGSGGRSGSTGGTGGASGGGVTPGCLECETTICRIQDSASGGLGCFNLTGTAKSVCEAAVACMRSTHCAMEGDASYCYCGTASQDDGSCSGAPLGPCIAALEAADPNILSTDTQAEKFAKLAADFVDATLPIGKATGLIGCDSFSCNTAATCAGQF